MTLTDSEQLLSDLKEFKCITCSPDYLNIILLSSKSSFSSISAIQCFQRYNHFSKFHSHLLDQHFVKSIRINECHSTGIRERQYDNSRNNSVDEAHVHANWS